MTLTITLIGIGVAIAVMIAIINILNPITFSPNFSGSTGEAARTQATETAPQTASSPTSWGGVVVGLVFAATLIGVFVWSPWKTGNNNSLSLYWEPAIGPHGEKGIRIFVGDLAPTSICFDSLAYVRQKGEKKDRPPTHCIKWNGGGSSFWVKPVELPKDKFVVAHTQ